MRSLAWPILPVIVACGGKTESELPSTIPPPTNVPVAPPGAGDPIAAAPPATSSPAAPPAAAPATAACIAKNTLDRDSFYVVSNGIGACAYHASDPACTRAKTPEEETLTIADLSEGVGTVRFVYRLAADGTHTVVGTKWENAQAGDTILTAMGIGASYTLDEALLALYRPSPAFACTWTE